MGRELIVLITLGGYAAALLLIGVWASRRTQNADDFFIGGRRLGPVVAAISASASSSSAWTLLGVSGAAFAWGLPALWLFPATLLGFIVNWFWVAPRLMPLAHKLGAVTLPDILASDASGQSRQMILRSTAVVIVVSFVFYVASQFQAAGGAFAETFGLTRSSAIILGGIVVLVYTYAGGFWAVSVTDTLQGLLMAATAVVLPIGALIAVGGFDNLMAGVVTDGSTQIEATNAMRYSGPAALGFAIGTLGIGLGYPGQPHVVNRLMALRDDRALVHGRLIAVIWAIVVYAGMILLGLCGRILADGPADGEQIFFVVTNSLFSPVVSGIMIAAVLSAIMSTADSQLLVVASSVSHDWFGERSTRLRSSRLAVAVLSILAVTLAIAAPATIFDRVLFAWHAVGSALGPLLLLMLAGFKIKPKFALASIWIGFVATILLHWLPDSPGDWLERLVPFAMALVVAAIGREKIVAESG